MRKGNDISYEDKKKSKDLTQYNEEEEHEEEEEEGEFKRD